MHSFSHRLAPLAFAVLSALFILPVGARDYTVRGPQGGLAMKVTLPDGFDPDRDRCPMVILMHGIFSRKDYVPMPQLAKALGRAGIASLRFDFDGHGASEGRPEDMTVPNEIADAKAIWDYVQGLPYVSCVGLLGHSQGGVIASMLAGQLAQAGGAVPRSMVLIAPGSVIKEATQGGSFFWQSFDPADPPERLKLFGGFRTLGRDYLVTTQTLDIYGTAAHYRGPVCLIHGTKDTIVPLWCSERYVATYGSDRATLHLVEGGDHTITRHRRQFVQQAVAFFQSTLVP